MTKKLREILAVPVAALEQTPTSPAPEPGVHLRVGSHVIDGQIVDVPGEPGGVVWWPLPVGRHIIDEKIQYATNPAAGLRIE